VHRQARFGTLVAAAVFVTVALAAGKAVLPVFYDPDPTQTGAGTLEGETWGKVGETATLCLTRIDDATRTTYILRRSGLDRDPFGTSPEHATGFISFHVLLENHSETRLVFQPQSCRLMTSWKDSSGPIDLPTIYTAYQIYDRPVPKNIDRVRAAILDGEIVLGPGEKRDGLMIYKAVDPKVKSYHIDVSATLTDGKPLAFTAFYKKRKS
jgi:hypothetical protein